jgi:hypothetical protein
MSQLEFGKVAHSYDGYKCVEIREKDHAQRFTNDDPQVPNHLRTIWLVGVDRNPRVHVGDVGRMEYVSERRRGFYRFIITEPKSD